jgi:TetR/AcrR family transcriptional regulator of autoinduction and epiphytic fitness
MSRLAVVTPIESDGRQLRGERTRTALADALLSLLEEGQLSPTAQRIAERAGVSLRIVFHHFTDLNSLLSIVAARQVARLRLMSVPISPDGPVEDRLGRFVIQRTRFLDRTAPVRRAAARVESSSEVIAEWLEWLRQQKRESVSRIFQPELQALPPADRDEVAAALWAAASFSTWETLRFHQKLPMPQARRSFARTIAGILQLDPATIPLDALHDGAES